MARYKMIVLSNSRSGADTQFRDWYKNTHIPEMLTVKGITSGTLHSSAVNAVGEPRHQYVASYELDTDNPNQLLEDIGQFQKSGKMTLSDTIAPDAVMSIFETL